ncbi:MAG TPA: hypothetical protein VFP84_33635 [Kofleriaceae bacterium]|nr:hypothetical protein [Kofleriaceae bacterium]
MADSAPGTDEATETEDLTTNVKMLPIQNSTRLETDPEAAASRISPAVTPHLQYFGGPLLTHVSVHPVWWRSTTRFQSVFNTYYGSVTNSPLYTMLGQYNIGAGSQVAGVTDNDTATSVSDASIHTELNRLFANGTLPAPNANNYYPIHFPQGVRITGPDGSQSCVQFCAYHGTYVRNGVNVYYGVIPDVGDPGCNGGCGTNTVQNNEQSVASHELVEATTDPAVGLATVFGPPLGWYDPNNGEIGDICNAQQGTTNGLVVQKEWSNAVNACVDH